MGSISNITICAICLVGEELKYYMWIFNSNGHRIKRFSSKAHISSVRVNFNKRWRTEFAKRKEMKRRKPTVSVLLTPAVTKAVSQCSLLSSPTEYKIYIITEIKKTKPCLLLLFHNSGRSVENTRLSFKFVSLRSKPSCASRTKSDRTKELFPIRAAQKMVRERFYFPVYQCQSCFITP